MPPAIAAARERTESATPTDVVARQGSALRRIRPHNHASKRVCDAGIEIGSADMIFPLSR